MQVSLKSEKNDGGYLHEDQYAFYHIWLNYS